MLPNKSDQNAYNKSANLPTTEMPSKHFLRTFDRGCTKDVAPKIITIHKPDLITELTTTKKIESIPKNLTYLMITKPQKKIHKVINQFSKYNMTKLNILLALFDNPMSLAEIVTTIPILNKTKKEHYDSVRTRVYRLRRTYTHPYISSDIRKGHYRYFLTKKGQKICCDLWYRLKHGLTMHIVKRYKITCHRPCVSCPNNPKKSIK